MAVFYLALPALILGLRSAANAIPQPNPQIVVPGTAVGTATNAQAGGMIETEQFVVSGAKISQWPLVQMSMFRR